MEYNYEIVENMIFSIEKNIQELAETCIDKGITNCYELMQIIELIEIKRK